MVKKRILYVSQEITPYLPENDLSKTSRFLPQAMNESGIDVRLFMPRFGCINERRHQLHEVIRLSGLNLVINDLDMPLIIKVASIPKERIQVYFIDNEEYFKRKATFTDSNGKLFEDNDERAIFFAKGVFETIKRLNWPPDLIHIHGWMAALLPLYLQQIYKDDPIFQNSKIITSLYGNEFDNSLNKNMLDKVLFDEIDNKHINALVNPTYENLMKIAIDSSDAIIKGSENISSEINDYLKNYKKPILDYQPTDSFAEPYMEFYDKILS